MNAREIEQFEAEHPFFASAFGLATPTAKSFRVDFTEALCKAIPVLRKADAAAPPPQYRAGEKFSYGNPPVEFTVLSSDVAKFRLKFRDGTVHGFPVGFSVENLALDLVTHHRGSVFARRQPQ